MVGNGDAALRKLALLMLLAGLAGPAFAARRVTVAQLQQVIAAAHDMPDAKMAQQLSELEMTERMSAARQALLAVSEASAFLDLPAEDIPAGAAPDGAAQDSLAGSDHGLCKQDYPKAAKLLCDTGYDPL